METETVIVTLEYRLAPANPFPAALNDCYATLQWLQSSTDEYQIDPNRIMIGGASAGGCIAIATALMARDRGDLTGVGFSKVWWLRAMKKQRERSISPLQSLSQSHLQGHGMPCPPLLSQLLDEKPTPERQR